MAPSTALILLLKHRWPEFRATTMGVLVCFYLGYALYVVFPAAPPRLVLVYEFRKNLRGYPHFLSSLSAQAFTRRSPRSRSSTPGATCGAGSGPCCPSSSVSGLRPSTCGTTTRWICSRAGCWRRARSGWPRGPTRGGPDGSGAWGSSRRGGLAVWPEATGGQRSAIHSREVSGGAG